MDSLTAVTTALRKGAAFARLSSGLLLSPAHLRSMRTASRVFRAAGLHGGADSARPSGRLGAWPHNPRPAPRRRVFRRRWRVGASTACPTGTWWRCASFRRGASVAGASGISPGIASGHGVLPVLLPRGPAVAGASHGYAAPHRRRRRAVGLASPLHRLLPVAVRPGMRQGIAFHPRLAEVARLRLVVTGRRPLVGLRLAVATTGAIVRVRPGSMRWPRLLTRPAMGTAAVNYPRCVGVRLRPCRRSRPHIGLHPWIMAATR